MHLAGELRKLPTPAEAKLWAALRGNKLDDINFRRQHAIGKYIVDFCSPKNKLVIELDGGQHADLEEYDMQRTEFLESQGYQVIRFSNHDVLRNLDSVIRAIHESIRSPLRPEFP
jgi:very-short-patch-repair endonuclease